MAVSVFWNLAGGRAHNTHCDLGVVVGGGKAVAAGGGMCDQPTKAQNTRTNLHNLLLSPLQYIFSADVTRVAATSSGSGDAGGG